MGRMTGSFSKRQLHVSLLGKYIHPVACLTYIMHQPSFILISVTSMSSPRRVLGQISFSALNQDALSRSWYCNSRNLLNLMSEPKGGLKTGSPYRLRRSIRMVTFPTAGIYSDACRTYAT
jgi:hypothetical protein